MLTTTPDGFVTSDDVAFLGEVTNALRLLTPQRDIQLWHIGGGIFSIQIPLQSGGTAACGVDEGTWLADILDTDGNIEDSVVLDIPQDIRDSPDKVAQVLNEHFPGMVG